jgi:hypothetical protein
LARNERMRSRLKAARVSPSGTDIFTGPKARKNPRVRSTKETLERRVHRLDNLAPTHRDRPSCRPTGNALSQRKLHRGSRKDPRAAALRPFEQEHQRGIPRSPHGLWDLTASQQPGAEGTAPAGHPIDVRTCVTDEPPACPLVEFRLIGDLWAPLRRAARWSGRVTQFSGQMGGEQLVVDQEPPASSHPMSSGASEMGRPDVT